jgi:threonine dehydratase
MSAAPWYRFDRIDIHAAAERLRGVVLRTPLVAFESADVRCELRLKLENRQVVGAFKARGAWNQVAQLTEPERRAGVVCTSSGNHGKALAWAAHRAGVRATIVMPANAYANKIAACRELGAEVVLCATRADCEGECERRVAAGATLVHPYDAERTVQGAGTVGLEIAEQWPAVELVLVPVGGGGLVSGVALALRRALGTRVKIFGVEPRGAPTLTRGLAAGEPVTLESTSKVQGLTPPNAGRVNIAIAAACLDGVLLIDDEDAFAAQKRLVRAGETVEPAGAAACAALFSGRVPAELLARRDARDPLRVVAVVSGGNPDPEQLERVRREIASESAGDVHDSGRPSASAAPGRDA